MIPGIPYWRLSSFYFFYFALVGTLSPYLSLYLEDIGLTAYAIGLVNGVLIGTKIIAPNVWGWLCDKTGARLTIISIGCVMASVFFAGLFFWQSLAAILVITFFYSFFWNAVLSQFETITVQYLKKDSPRYSQVRVWGSIGFTTAVVLLGWLFDIISIQYLIPIAWVLLCLISISCFTLKEPAKKTVQQTQGHWLKLLKKPEVIAFFIAAFLLQFSFGAYYSFFSLHLESVGYSRLMIGIVWAVGVLAEVVLFLYMPRIMRRYALSQLLFWSLLLTAIRWLVIAFLSDNLGILFAVQLLHALSFGAAHAACIEMIRQFFKGSHAGQGQALYSSVTFGLGGAMGAISGGFLWDISGALLYSVSALAAFIAALIVYFFLRIPSNKQHLMERI